jgi:hypothetical protein
MHESKEKETEGHSNTKSTKCQSSGRLNEGTNTNVKPNSAGFCENHGPDTTTIYQRDRVIVKPNH